MRLRRRDFLQLALGSLVAAACTDAGAPGAPSTTGAAAATTGKTTADVIVLGAGMSGISAARRLRDRGIADVFILEARDRIGGRIHTDRSTGSPIDLGASWLHYANDPTNPLLPFVQQAGLTPKLTDWDIFSAYDSATGAISDDTLGTAEDAYEAILEKGADQIRKLPSQEVPVAGVLNPLFAQKFTTAGQTRLLNLLNGYYFGDDYACDLSEMGAYELVAWEDDDTKEDDQLVGGYDKLVEMFAQGLDIRLSTVVQRVTLTDDGVTIATSNGTFSAKSVIVTLPVSILRSGAIEFDPPLPADKTTAIEQIGFGDLEKVVAIYDQPFWPTTPHGFGFATDDTTAAQIVLNMVPTANLVALMGFWGGSPARALSPLSDDAVAAQFIAQLRAMFGANIPSPKNVLRTNWTADPYAKGTYTYSGVHNRVDEVTAIAAPVAGKLHFAGEATEPKWNSTVHGAYLSGIRAANEVGT